MNDDLLSFKTLGVVGVPHAYSKQAGCALLEGPICFRDRGITAVLSIYTNSIVVLDTSDPRPEKIRLLRRIQLNSAVGMMIGRKDGKIIAATRNEGIMLCDPSTGKYEVMLGWSGNPRIRSNDGQVCPGGNSFTRGTINDDNFSDPIAGLKIVHCSDGVPQKEETLIEGGVVSNGHWWNEDGTEFFCIESTNGGKIDVYEWTQGGQKPLGKKKREIDLSAVVGSFPDGSRDDDGVLLGGLLDGAPLGTSSGNALIAAWGKSSLIITDPDGDGSSYQLIDTPFRRPTSFTWISDRHLLVTAEFKDGDRDHVYAAGESEGSVHGQMAIIEVNEDLGTEHRFLNV